MRVGCGNEFGRGQSNAGLALPMPLGVVSTTIGVLNMMIVISLSHSLSAKHVESTIRDRPSLMYKAPALWL